jgi:hypothetical protein
MKHGSENILKGGLHDEELAVSTNHLIFLGRGKYGSHDAPDRLFGLGKNEQHADSWEGGNNSFTEQTPS